MWRPAIRERCARDDQARGRHGVNASLTLYSPCSLLMSRALRGGCDDPLPFLWPTVSEVERQHILDTLRRCHGNRTRAAKLLGISLRGLRLKLREYGQEGFAVADPEPLEGQRRLQL